MENENLEKHRERFRRYKVITDYYKENPSLIEANRGYLHQIKNILIPFDSLYFVMEFGREIAREFNDLVLNLDSDLTKLLSQN